MKAVAITDYLWLRLTKCGTRDDGAGWDFRRTGKLTLLLFSFNQPATIHGPSSLIYPYIVQWLFRDHWTYAGINRPVRLVAFDTKAGRKPHE